MDFTEVDKKHFNDFIDNYPHRLRAEGNGSMGIDYFEDDFKIAYYSHGFASDSYFIRYNLSKYT